MSAALHTEVVSSAGRLLEIGPAWDALWRRCGQSVFQSHGWIVAWWGSRPAGDRSRLCVGLCWMGDELVAIMPFATRRRRGVRVLEWAAKDCSDYCDALVDPTESGPALEQAWAMVAAGKGFDLAYLSHVRPDAALHRLLDRQQRGLRLRPGRRSARSLQVRHPASDGPAWFRGLDAATQDRHARGMQAIGAMGPVRSEMHGPGDIAADVIDQMIGLKRRQLATSGQSYPILDNDASALRALVNELARQHALRIFSLHCGDHLVAALLNIATGTRMQVFFAAYDPRFEHATPETLAIVEFIIRALDIGVAEVDLLCVGAGDTFTFTNAQLDLASFVGAKTLIGRLALMLGERLERPA